MRSTRDPVLWESSDDGVAAESRLCGQSEAGDAADAQMGIEALYTKPSWPGSGRTRDVPYLLRA